MPVFSEKVIPNERTHTKGTSHTKLNLLADWIDLNEDVWIHNKIHIFSEKYFIFRKMMGFIRYPYETNGIASPGDIIRWFSLFFVLILTPLLVILLIIEKICIFIKT